MRAVPHQGPVGRVGLNPFAELFVFRAAAREYRDEAPAGAIDVIHVLARAQLGISHIEKVRPTRHGAERVPGLDMGARVASVAVATAERDGDTAVAVHGENEQELFEIGAVVLGVAVGDRRGGAPADLAA